MVLLVALAFAGLVALGVPHVDGRSYGGFLALMCSGELALGAGSPLSD